MLERVLELGEADPRQEDIGECDGFIHHQCVIQSHSFTKVSVCLLIRPSYEIVGRSTQVGPAVCQRPQVHPSAINVFLQEELVEHIERRAGHRIACSCHLGKVESVQRDGGVDPSH